MLKTAKEQAAGSEAAILWNELVRKARMGDAEAARRFFLAAQPLIDRLCRVPYFAARLGKDEVQSLSYIRLAEFLRSEAAIPANDREVPWLLKRILRFHIINAVNKTLLRDKYEMTESALLLPSEEETGNCAAVLENLAADVTANPEAVKLQDEFRDECMLLVRQLTKQEQAVIRKLYLQQKTPAEAAAEMHYSARGLRNLRQRALGHLRDCLEQRFPHYGANTLLEEYQWTK
ncbi:MAG: sigma-70 family RNA polymerase sigma factor [Acidaminococcaceae bacterium]|nr:sigma-70 family RNA polymerase sigma factor [Acidaminococcaceae bacterium]